MNDYEEKHLNLKKKIFEKLDSQEEESTQENVSLKDIFNGFNIYLKKYNDIFITNVADEIKRNNKYNGYGIISKKNNKNFKIRNMSFGILENGDKYVKVTYLKNDGTFAYKTIFCNDAGEISSTFSCMDSYEALTNTPNDLKLYFSILNNFKNEFPNITYNWNRFEKHIEIINADDLISGYIDFNNNYTGAIFANLDDSAIATGILRDYVEFYNDEIAAKSYTSIDKLSPILQSTTCMYLEDLKEFKLCK